MSRPPWWHGATIYQVYPRSFCDSNGDGIGDLDGIVARLDHIVELGVDAIWLSPFFCSPQRDFGYDVSDYLHVDPSQGSDASLARLIDGCRRRGLRLIFDLVVNHTSDQHPWFVEAITDRTSPRRQWYHFRHSASPKRPPNNWKSAFGGSAWSYSADADAWYLHSFSPTQPDLNWANHQVQHAVLGIMQHWLERGVSGFRLDVVNCYAKDPDYRDNPRRLHPFGLVHPSLGQRHVYDRDQPTLVPIVEKMRALVDRYDGLLVGEVLDEWGRFENIGLVYAGGRGVHAAFDFALLHARFTAQAVAIALRDITARARQLGRPAWAIGNHDFPRLVKRYRSLGSRQATAKLAAALLLTLPGPVVLYNGDEIGIGQLALRRDQLLDPLGQRFWPFYRGRDGCRAPLAWNDQLPNAGFSSTTPWLPLETDGPDVRRQLADDDSVLACYRRLGRLRRELSELRLAPLTEIDAARGLLSYRRKNLRVVLNLSRRVRRTPVVRGARLLFSTRADRRLACCAEQTIVLDAAEGVLLAD